MLYRAKSEYNKIAMGLLSYTPNCQTTAEIVEEINWYHGDDQRALYLFKEDRDGDPIGLLGIEKTKDQIIIVRAVALNPSYSNEGYRMQMLDELQDLYPQAKITSTLQTNDVVGEWQTTHKKEQNNERNGA